MGKTTRSIRAREGSFVPLGLLVVGVLALCGAVVYPFQQLFWQLDLATLFSAEFVVPPETTVIVASLVLLSLVTFVYGILLLSVRM